MGGRFKRVTVARTGKVEHMEVVGHWWDHEHHESRLGRLERSVVRELNLRPLVRNYAARINHVNRVIQDKKELLQMFVDLAIDEQQTNKTSTGPKFR